MARVPATTVILICSDRIARMDFGAMPRMAPVHRWQAQRLAAQAMEHAIDSALSSGGRCGRNVWVLCEDLWTQTLTLPAAAVAGLGEAQLRGALAFELESLSGVGAAESELAYVPGGSEAGGEAFWVTQASKGDVLGIQNAVAAAGGRLRSICHPAGLPRPWEPAASGHPWWRLEAWGDITLCLSGRPDGTVGRHFIRSSPGEPQWKRAVADWVTAACGAKAAELLYRWPLPSDALFDGLTNLSMLPKLEGEAMERWLTLWAAALESATPGVPMIRPPARVLPKRTYAAVAAALAAVVLAACVAHGTWNKNRLASATVEVERLQTMRQESSRLAKRAEILEAQIKELTGGQDAAGTGDDKRRQQCRVGSLLAALGSQGCPDRVITRLRCEGQGGVTVEGLCLRPELADNLAVDLGRLVAAKGWDVRGAQKTARMAAEDGGPWEFQVTLLPAAAPKPSPSPSPLAAANAAGGSR